jgi:hypothetical protein
MANSVPLMQVVGELPRLGAGEFELVHRKFL